MSFNAKPGPNISNSDWSTHSWNKGGIRGNYQDYRDLIGGDILSGYGDDNIFSRDELNAITNTKYDIRGDGRAPHTGNYFDQGAATQDAIARLITTKGITTTDDILQQYGLRQDQATGDIISSAGYNHSAFGSGAGNEATWEGYGSKADFGGSHYSYGDFEDGKIPTWRYKYSGDWTPPETTPKTPAPPYETPDDLIKEKAEWEAATQPKGPKVGDFGWDQDTLPITVGDLFGDKPGGRLGVDRDEAERYGSIPFVTAGQYYGNLDRPNTRYGSKFGGGGGDDNFVGLHKTGSDSFGGFLKDNSKFKGGKTLATKLLDEMSIG